jgi:hypothetical protein
MSSGGNFACSSISRACGAISLAANSSTDRKNRLSSSERTVSGVTSKS